MQVVATAPSPRVGTYDWVRQTHGELTAAEKGTMLLHQVRFLWDHLWGQFHIRFGLVPQSCRIGVQSLVLPATRCALNAVVACRAQPSHIVEHAFRTWYIGKMLAALDGYNQLDDELFFCAALLHDWGLTNPSSTDDFTRASADTAARCASIAGVAPARVQELRDGICEHASTGVSRADNPIAYYVQWGAMSDIAGLRRWRIGHEDMQQIRCWHPYGSDFQASMIATTRAEARAFPEGRFAFYVDWHLAWLIEHAPLYP